MSQDENRKLLKPYMFPRPLYSLGAMFGGALKIKLNRILMHVRIV